MQFAAKEIEGSRRSRRSRTGEVRKGWPGKDNKRMVIEHKLQKLPEKVAAWSDADFAGCKRTRRSTAGGVVTFGSHCIKTYSQTQETIALSSGESEFYGTVKAAAM